MKLLKITALLVIFFSSSYANVMLKTSESAKKLSSPKVVSVPISEFIDPSKNELHKLELPAVNKLEASNIRQKMLALPPFPSNSYSGCHVRAHFDYLKLREIASKKLYKVWLFSSSLLSPSAQGAISFKPDNGNITSWDYHVAVAYTDSQGQEWIIDRLISSEPLNLSKWQEKFEVRGYAVLTRVQPEKYLFNKTSVPASDPINYPNGFLSHFVPKNVFNGTFYEYIGLAAEQHWGASDLAADSLSSALQNSEFPQCKWIESASQSLILKQEVLSASIPIHCEGAVTLFKTQFEVWKARGL